MDTPRTLQVWFDFASNYSYLSVMRLEQAASARGIAVQWKPFLLGPVFQALGFTGAPFIVQPVKGAYVWHDMRRQCAKYGLPAWRMSSRFPRTAVLPLRLALLGEAQPWIGAFCCRVMAMNFVDDREVDSPEAMRAVLGELGLPADELLHEAVSDANKLRLREQTAQAQALGIFGAPTFFVGDEMFWGDDRLDDALDWAARA
jgi:2-hydroxychromene-2-carboxylate isomerase